MVLLAVATVVIILMLRAMPDSDSTAVVDGLTGPNFVRVKRFVNGTAPALLPTQTPTPTPKSTSTSTLTNTSRTSPVVVTASFTGIIVRPSSPTKITSLIIITRPKEDLPGWVPPKATKAPGIAPVFTANFTTVHTDFPRTTTGVGRDTTDWAGLEATFANARSGSASTSMRRGPGQGFVVQPEETGDTVETQTIVTTLPPSQTVVVVTPAPSTVISTVEATVVTSRVIASPVTIETMVDGTLVKTTSTPPPREVVTTIPRSVVTRVETNPAKTFVSTGVGLAATLIAVVTLPGSGPRLTTETIVSVTGGVRTTVTPRPVTFVTTSNGAVVTRISTPPPYVTTTGGTTFTMTRVTVPPRVFTTAFTTTISGKPTTISMTFSASSSPTPIANPKTTGRDTDSSGEYFPGISRTVYLAATFLPTLIAVILALPITIIDTNAKLFQPFRALSSSERQGVGVGVPGEEAMMVRYGGVYALLTPWKQLLRGDAVVAVTTLLVGCSWTLAPLASEAIGIKLHGKCTHLSISGCAISVGVSRAPALALVGIMSAMVLFLGILALLLRKWDTGVLKHPWCLAEMAMLARNKRLREPLARISDANEKRLEILCKKGRFRLGMIFPVDDGVYIHEKEEGAYLTTGRGGHAYGIVPHWEDTSGVVTDEKKMDEPKKIDAIELETRQPPHLNPFTAPFPSLTYTCRIGFILLLLSLMALLIYYFLSRGDTPFELFMDSQTFGVKFLFAAIGGVIALFWCSLFLSIAAVAPFYHMFSSPSNCTASFFPSLRGGGSQSPISWVNPTNAVSGVFTALRRRDVILFATGSMSLAGELLPVFLANIPYALTLTYDTHRTCTFLSLAILGVMVLVLVATLFVQWPFMPVDPRTLVGAMYYVVDSEMLMRELAAREKSCESRYFYSRVVGSNGQARMAVDVY